MRLSGMTFFAEDIGKPRAQSAVLCSEFVDLGGEARR